MQQIEAARHGSVGSPGVEEFRRHEREQRREGVAIVLALAAGTGLWIGLRLVSHFESRWVSAAGLGMLFVGWLAWKALHDS